MAQWVDRTLPGFGGPGMTNMAKIDSLIVGQVSWGSGKSHFIAKMGLALAGEKGLKTLLVVVSALCSRMEDVVWTKVLVLTPPYSKYP